jgi:type I restriction enzyme S subunit
MVSGDIHLKRIADVAGRITELGLNSSNAKLIAPPAVAVALAGQGKTRGTVALALAPLTTNQSVALIKPTSDRLDTVYLYYALGFRYEELRSRSSGEGRAGLSKGLLEKIPIPLPPPEQQTSIADILTTVDQAIEQTEALIAKQRRIKAGLLHDLLTRGIDEHGRLRDPSTHRFKPSPVGLVPEEWEVQPLTGLAEIGTGVTLGRIISGPDTIELPYLRVANVQDGYIDLSEVKKIRVYHQEVSRFLLQSGDVLMNEGGDYDKLGRGTVWRGQISPCLHQNHVFRVRANQAKLLPDFLALVSASPYGKRFFVLSSKQSTNLASINSTQLKAFPVPLPPATEQQGITEVLGAADIVLETEGTQLAKLQRLKAGLMQDLLSGRVPVAGLRGQETCA